MTNAEAIVEARRKTKAGEFKRQIVKRTPRNILVDKVELECGHSTGLLAETTSEYEDCQDCAERWVAENSKEA
jgi:hypothetical protein